MSLRLRRVAALVSGFLIAGGVCGIIIGNWCGSVEIALGVLIYAWAAEAAPPP